MGFPISSVSKESVCSAVDPDSTLGQEDPLGREKATHFSILDWKIPRTEEPGGLQPMWSQESDMT